MTVMRAAAERSVIRRERNYLSASHGIINHERLISHQSPDMFVLGMMAYLRTV